MPAGRRHAPQLAALLLLLPLPLLLCGCLRALPARRSRAAALLLHQLLLHGSILLRAPAHHARTLTPLQPTGDKAPWDIEAKAHACSARDEAGQTSG